MNLQSLSVFYDHIKAVVMTSSMLRLGIIFFKYQTMIMLKATILSISYGLPVCC